MPSSGTKPSSASMKVDACRSRDTTPITVQSLSITFSILYYGAGDLDDDDDDFVWICRRAMEVANWLALDCSTKHTNHKGT